MLFKVSLLLELLAVFLCTAAVSEQGSLCDQHFSWTNKMFKVLSVLLVGLLLQLHSAKGQPTLEPPNVVSVIEGETFSACFGVDDAPVGGDFVVNVMANPEALPNNVFGDYSTTLTFIDGDDSPQCITTLRVPLDDVFQSPVLDDVFIVTTTFQGVTSDPFVTANIVIMDRTELTIGFSQPSYTFVEVDNTTQNQVCVNISNGTIAGGAVALTATIVYETDMTAAMSDITPGNLMVTFTENIGSEACVVLGVNEDGEVEGAETLIVRLVSADNPLMIDPTMDMATISILDIDANCGPPPMGDGVTAAPSSPPYGMDPSGALVANPGAVATYTCEDPDNMDNLMGESMLTCTLVGDTSAEWVPAVAPSCPEPETTTKEPDDTTESSTIETDAVTAGAPSTYSSVAMLMTVTGLCLGQLAV